MINAKESSDIKRIEDIPGYYKLINKLRKLVSKMSTLELKMDMIKQWSKQEERFCWEAFEVYMFELEKRIPESEYCKFLDNLPYN